jgi:hypothetical protein
VLRRLVRSPDIMPYCRTALAVLGLLPLHDGAADNANLICCLPPVACLVLHGLLQLPSWQIECSGKPGNVAGLRNGRVAVAANDGVQVYTTCDGTDAGKKTRLAHQDDMNGICELDDGRVLASMYCRRMCSIFLDNGVHQRSFSVPFDGVGVAAFGPGRALVCCKIAVVLVDYSAVPLDAPCEESSFPQQRSDGIVCHEVKLPEKYPEVRAAAVFSVPIDQNRTEERVALAAKNRIVLCRRIPDTEPQAKVDWLEPLKFINFTTPSYRYAFCRRPSNGEFVVILRNEVVILDEAGLVGTFCIPCMTEVASLATLEAKPLLKDAYGCSTSVDGRTLLVADYGAMRIIACNFAVLRPITSTQTVSVTVF